MAETSANAVIARLQPGRRPDGIVAVLMPFLNGSPDYGGLVRQIRRVSEAGLTTAVNMDTGYVQWLSPAQRGKALAVTCDTVTACSGAAKPRFVAGAFVENGPGSLADRYRREMDRIEALGGTPILFPCPELRALSEPEAVDLFRKTTGARSGVLLFELGEMFVPYGRIYSAATFEALLDLPGVAGLKHSSLRREAEWARLQTRDLRRPDFRVYTGNDLAIDMIMYGSDYLLGLASFHAEAFARRDQLWEAGDARFYGLNDRLQYLGAFAFRHPVPAYRHDAARFLRLRGIIESDAPPAGAPMRPEGDQDVLQDILHDIEEELLR